MSDEEGVGFSPKADEEQLEDGVDAGQVAAEDAAEGGEGEEEEEEGVELEDSSEVRSSSRR